MKRSRSSRLAALTLMLSMACQPTHGFRFLNPSPSRRVVQLLESAEGDTAAVHGNAACAAMRPLRSPVGIVDTLHVMPDSSRTWMIAFGTEFSPAARYCLIAYRQGGREADTLYLAGDTVLAHTRGGVLTVQLYPTLAIVPRPQE